MTGVSASNSVNLTYQDYKRQYLHSKTEYDEYENEGYSIENEPSSSKPLNFAKQKKQTPELDNENPDVWENVDAHNRYDKISDSPDLITDSFPYVSASAEEIIVTSDACGFPAGILGFPRRIARQWFARPLVGATRFEIAKRVNKGVDFKDKKGRDIYVKNKRLVHFVTLQNSSKKVNKLIECGFTFNEQDKKNKNSAFFLSIIHNKLEAFEAILSGDTTLEIRAKHPNSGKTALHFMAEHNRRKMVKSFLDQLENTTFKDELLNETDNNGQTALHVAAQKNHHDIVQKLVDAKANCIIHDNKQCIPKHIAPTTIFRKKSGNILSNPTATQLIEQEIKEKAEGYLQMVANAKDLDISSIIHLCVKDIEGNTPLHYAVAKGDVRAVKYLLDHYRTHTTKKNGKIKYAVLMKNRHGYSPLDMAEDLESREIKNLLKTFISKNARDQIKKSSEVVPETTDQPNWMLKAAIGPFHDFIDNMAGINQNYKKNY